MKKLLFIIILLTLFFSPVTRLHAEEIASYDVDISIQRDGKIAVSENILYDFGTLEKHGIFWSFPYIKTNSEGKRFTLDVQGLTVLDEKNTPYRFARTTGDGQIKLQIGDPNVYVSGKRLYAIKYEILGGITYFSDHDELFWNAIGTGGILPIQSAGVNVHLPESMDESSLQFTCYIGKEGETVSDCTYTYKNGVTTFVSGRSLAPGERFAVVLGFPKNMVAVLEPKPVNTWLPDLIAVIVFIFFTVGMIFWYLILPIWIVIHWLKVGRDPKPSMGVASAWFDVPKTEKKHRPLTPGETGTLVDETADMRDITATIVDLARRGFLKIIEKKKGDFYLEKRNGSQKGDMLERFEKTLYDGIFSGSDLLRIKDADIISSVSKTKTQLYEAVVAEKFFLTDPESIRTKYTIIGAIAVFTMNFPLALSAFIFGRAMPRKTSLGAQCAAVAQSLKNFITSQDRQYRYQANNQIFFEKFLPYAIVFGVEKIWAERFKDIGLKKPDWYDGYSMRTFNSIYLVNSLSSSMHSFTSSATPTSSSSGFSSGFSGGGGGGGGGGSSVGGSW